MQAKRPLNATPAAPVAATRAAVLQRAAIALPVAAPVLPPYLYHAAPRKNARVIAGAASVGLEQRSGPVGAKYLCMSGVEAGATTLGRAARDVVFRVNTVHLTAGNWRLEGAGRAEWRGTEDIPKANLEWRWFLNDAVWKSVTANPPT